MPEVSIHPASSDRIIDRLHQAFLDGDDASAMKVNEARNVLQLQEIYRALARGDFHPAIALMADGIALELHAPPEVPITGCWRGVAEVTAAMQRNFGSLADQRAELLSVVAQGDTVVLLAEEHGTVRATGTPYRVRWVQFFTFRHDKIVSIRGVAAQLLARES
jgi:ketosteroid isomerase-like protein